MDPLERYIHDLSSPEEPLLHELDRQTNLRIMHPRMISGHIQGRLLRMIVQMLRPRTILEIGTFTGYSAICMAEGLQEGGKVYTFDVNDELEDFTRKWIEGSPVADKICYRIGSALDEAPALGVTFDLVFIDGDKREYIEYYQMAMDILRTGGWIIADNTLWDGHVIEPDRRDAQTESVRRFNELIGKDNRVEKVILPLRDGLTIIRKK